MTEYNTNIILLSKNDRMRIWILFDLSKETEYKYEYSNNIQIPNYSLTSDVILRKHLGYFFFKPLKHDETTGRTNLTLERKCVILFSNSSVIQ